MKKVFLILCLLSACIASFANRAGAEWSYQIPTEENFQGKEIIVLPDSSISVFRTITLGNIDTVHILRLTSNGEFIEDIETQISETATDHIQIMDVAHSPGYYILVMYSAIYKISEDGVTIWENNLAELNYPNFRTVKISSSETYLIGGTGSTEHGTMVFELTNQSDLIWNHTYFESNNQAYVSSIIEVGEFYYATGMINEGASWAITFQYNMSGEQLVTSLYYHYSYSEDYTPQFAKYDNNNIWYINETRINKRDSLGNYSDHDEFEINYKDIFVTNESKLWLQSDNSIIKLDPSNQYQEISRFESENITKMTQSHDGKPLIIRRVGDIPFQGSDFYIEKIDENLTIDELYNLDLDSFNLTNHPNPFNPTTTISYSLAESQKVELEIYNIRGQLVRTLVNSNQPAGKNSVVWNGTNDNNNPVSSGIYFSRLKTSEVTQSKKLMLLK